MPIDTRNPDPIAALQRELGQRALDSLIERCVELAFEARELEYEQFAGKMHAEFPAVFEAEVRRDDGAPQWAHDLLDVLFKIVRKIREKRNSEEG